MNIFNGGSFHDQRIIDIKCENNDLLLIVKDDLGVTYKFNLKNITVKGNTDVNINDLKGAVIIALSYHNENNGNNYIHLETVSKNIPFNDEFYIYADNISISNE